MDDMTKVDRPSLGCSGHHHDHIFQSPPPYQRGPNKTPKNGNFTDGKNILSLQCKLI